MEKKHCDFEAEQVMAAEAIAPYTLSNYHATSKVVSARERVMAGTVSVDEYFDELLSKLFLQNKG